MSYRVPGPCTIAFGISGAEVDIGVTKQGIIIRPNTSFVPITDDARGNVPGTYLFGGKSCILEVIGMQLSMLQAANIWDGTVLQQGGTVGKLASASAQSLKITESDGTSLWKCLAFATDPREIGLKSTQETNVPLMFVVISVGGKLFNTVPSYIHA